MLLQRQYNAHYQCKGLPTLGMRKYLNGRYQAAIEDFNAAITSNPNYALAYYKGQKA